MLETACMGAASVLTVHVCDFMMHSFAALAYGKRRRHHTSAGRQKNMLSETEGGVAVGYNVERPVQEAVLPSDVSIAELWWRGRHLRRSQGASGKRTKPWS